MKTAAGKIYTMRRAAPRATGPSPWGSPRLLLKSARPRSSPLDSVQQGSAPAIGEGQQGTPHHPLCTLATASAGAVTPAATSTKMAPDVIVPRMAFAREQIPRPRYHNTLPQEDIEQGAGDVSASSRSPLSLADTAGLMRFSDHASSRGPRRRQWIDDNERGQ